MAMKHPLTLLALAAMLGLSACAPATVPAPEPVFTQMPTPTAQPLPTEGPKDMATPDPADDQTESHPLEGSGDPNANPPYTVLEAAQVLPQPGEEALDRGPVFLDASAVVDLEGVAAAQTALQLTGTLPDPCHALRVDVGEPDASNDIQVDVYSVVLNPDLMCVQVLVPFEVTVPFADLAAGEYRILVNDQEVGTFTK